MNPINKKLVLGTVQLGMKYGMNNNSGQPTRKESFSILDKALASGIDTFDTAWAYGEAEDVLGEWIKKRSLAGKIHVISKMKPHALNDYPDGTKSSDIVQMELKKSLKRLNVDYLDGYLLHSPHYVYMTHVMDGLRKVKEAGLVKNIGVSVYNEPEALQVVELGVDYVQVPYNIFDQRLDATNFFKIAKKNKVAVFARSPFLQGLLLMDQSKLPTHLSYLKPYLHSFINLSKEFNLTPLEATLFFVKAECKADHIVFGVDNLEQLVQNIDIFNKPASSKNNDFIKKAKESFKNINNGAINPSLWSKIKI